MIEVSESVEAVKHIHKFLRKYFESAFAVNLIMAVVAGIASAGIFGIATFFDSRSPALGGSPTLDQRIKQLSEQLSSASSAISGIEVEIQARQELVKKLEEDQQKYEALSELEKDQVEAVGQALRAEINSSKSFFDTLPGKLALGFVPGTVFFLLGTFIVGPMRERRRMRPTSPEESLPLTRE